jgi:hypothetical protein
MNPRVNDVQYKSKYKLLLTFSNGETGEFDFSSYLNYPVYTLLQDEFFCQKAKVFNGTVVWNDEIDFDPDRLYLKSKKILQAQ